MPSLADQPTPPAVTSPQEQLAGHLLDIFDLNPPRRKKSIRPKWRKRSVEPSLASVAYHEAGHALGHIYEGAAFESVTITPDLPHGILGILRTQDDSIGSRLAALRDIRILLLGAAAEIRYAGYSESVRLGARHDVETVRSLAQSWRITPIDLMRCVKDACRLLFSERDWNAVVAIAEELLRRKTLLAPEAIAVAAAGSTAGRANENGFKAD